MAFSLSGLRAQLAPIPPQAPLWLACSGGHDSTLLLHALSLLREAGELPNPLQVVHVHHGLHPDASLWADYVAHACRVRQIPYNLLMVDARAKGGEGPEAAAREARYGAIAGRLAPGDWLLTAQHADDQAETLLLRLLRGAGVRGLGAMRTQRPFGAATLLRPLLPYSRATLEAWSADQGLEWVEDPSNADPRYDRNRLRHQLLPTLQARWPAAVQSLCHSAAHCAEADRLHAELAALDVAPATLLDPLELRCLAPLSDHRRRNLMRHWLLAQGAEPPPEARLATLLTQALEAGAGRRPLVQWGMWRVRRFAGRLYLHTQGDERPMSLSLTWDLQGRLELPSGLGHLVAEPSETEGVVPDVLDGGVRVTLRQGGERYRPYAGGHSRPLKAWLQEQGVPPWERERLPLIYLGDELLQVGDRLLAVTQRSGPRGVGVVIRHRHSA